MERRTVALGNKQQRFVEEYLVDLNATQAAIRAGYGIKGAAQQASRLLSTPEVASAIAKRRAHLTTRLEVSQERVLREYARMAFYDPASLGVDGIDAPDDITKLPEDVRRAIVGWSWDKAGNFTLKLADKQAALTSLARHLGMFTDRIEFSSDFAGMMAAADARAKQRRPD